MNVTNQEKIVHSYTADIFLRLTLFNDEQAIQLQQAFHVLSHVKIITRKLFAVLQAAHLIAAEIDFDIIEGSLVLKGEYYEIPVELADLFLQRPQLESSIMEELSQLCLENYRELLNNYSFSNNEENITLYKQLYTQIFTLSMERDLEALSNWMIPASLPLYLNKNQQHFISPFLIQFRMTLKQENSLSTHGRLAQGIAIYWLSEIHKNNAREQSRDDRDRAITILQKVEKEAGKLKADKNTQWSDQDDKLLCDWLSEAYKERGSYQLDLNLYSKSFDDFRASDALAYDANLFIEIGRAWQGLGGFLFAEEQWKRLQKHAAKDEIFKGGYLYYLGKFYDDIGYWEDALAVKQYVLALETQQQPGEKDIWYCGALRELGIIQAEMLMQRGEKNTAAFATATRQLEESLALAKAIDRESHSIICYLWLARISLHLGNTDICQQKLDQGLKLLSVHYPPNSKMYFEFSIALADLYYATDNREAGNKIIVTLYKKIPTHLGRYNPLLISVIERLYLTGQSHPRLDYHLVAIRHAVNPFVRTNTFEEITLDNTAAILQKIRENHISLIPADDNVIHVKCFKLPFFKEHSLLKLTIKGVKFEVIRNFIFKDLENITLLERTNAPVYNTAEKDLFIEDHQAAVDYIRFFFDIVDGRHGKFFVIEDQQEAGIMWHVNISLKKAKEASEILQQQVKPLRFLYEEEKMVGDKQVTLWHFSGCILFKNSLFSNKIELNITTGTIRLYNEEVIAENLPLSVDIKATLN